MVTFLRIKYRTEFKPHRQIRSNVIKNALKTYVVGPLESKYQVCAVRYLCVDGLSKEKIWMTKRLLESLLEENSYVVCFFSCITALSEGNYRKKNRWSNKDSNNSEEETVAEQIFCPGISLWILFNWPDSGLAAFEEYISVEILAAGLDLRSYKAIRGRGKISLLLFP